MDVTLAELATSFGRDCRARGRAHATVRLYSTTLRLYGQWLEETGHPATLSSLTRDTIRSWLAHLADDHATSTLATRYAAMRRFSTWLLEEGEVATDPMAGMRSPKPKHKPVPLLADDDLAALLKTCSGRSFEDRRDEAIFRTLLDAGLRVSELTGLTVDSIDLDRETAIVSGKGDKVRQVYFSTRTVRALDRYLRERRKHRWAHLPFLFLSQRGQLKVEGVRERLKVRADQAGLADRVNPHRFRHTFAHDFLINGGQERDLKRLAGWSSDIMLERYGSSAADVRAAAAARRLRRGDRV